MTTNTTKTTAAPTELELLKAQADVMGITYKSNITAKTLRKNLMDALTEDDDSEGMSNADRNLLEAENTKLVRVIVTPMASHMKDHQGQLFAVGNAILGVISKYVLFNAEYHIPKIILNHIQEQEMQYFVRAKVNGQDVRESRMRKAFSVEVLDPLTADELKELGRSQENRNAVDA